MNRILDIIRTTELRIVVLAVVLGHAVATGLGHVISLIVTGGNLFLRSRDMAGYEHALKAMILTGLTSLVLWILVAGGTLLLIQRVLGSAEDRRV